MKNIKRMKNVFFMLLIAMTLICGSAVNAEPTASPAADAAAAQSSAAPEASTAPEASPTAKPTPEATVAPELADNQVAVKEGATDLIFTITHTDTIEISVSSPKNIVLDTTNPRVTTKSVAGGTEVHVSEPEAGIWTMNASSMNSEAITVKGAVMYNFVVELQSEKGVIYSGVPNKFIAFVKTKDGSKIDPDILRTATMNLLIKEADSEKPKEVAMTFKGAAFETMYTHNKVERISVSALAVINDAEVQSNSLEIISIVDPNQSKGLPIGVIILIVVLLTAGGVFVYIKFADRFKGKKGVKNMSGNLTINISVNGDEKLPVTRNLAMLGTSAGMLSIIGDDEYYDVDGITISGAENSIKVVNKSRCEVRFSNVDADPAGVNLFDEQYFKIFMPDDRTVITVTYHSGDIFSGLINNAAAEQQNKLSEMIEAQQAAVVTAEELYKEFDNPEEVFEDTQKTEPAEPAQTAAEAPALESLNLSEATEDAVPEVQEEKADEVSDEAVEEMSSFTVDTSDAEQIAPAADADVDYTPDTAPALESFSFDMSGTEENEQNNSVEEQAVENEAADKAVEEMSSFTVDTSDAEQIAPAADADVDYTPDAAPALESFSFDMSGTEENEQNNSVEEQAVENEAADKAAEEMSSFTIDTSDAEQTATAADSEETNESGGADEPIGMSMFSDLASLANEIAGSAAETSDEKPSSAQNDDTGIDFSNLVSLAADAAAENTQTNTIDIDDTEDLFDLQHLADEITKE